MSAFNDLDIACPQCMEEFRGTVWTAIHAGADPELKELLLGGELNLAACPQCNHISFQDHFLIYQDPADELIAYVYPEHEAENRADLERLMLSGFKEAQATFPPEERLAYDPIIVFGLEALVEMVREEIDETEQSDVAEAVCKEKHIGFVRLKPSKSRQLKLPRVLPREGQSKEPTRDDVARGIKKLLAENPLLTRYADCLKEVETKTGNLFF